jgi:hypothetical protein
MTGPPLPNVLRAARQIRQHLQTSTVAQPVLRRFRRPRRAALTALLVLVLVVTARTVVIASVSSAATTFRDDFDGPSGPSTDPAKWSRDVGGGGYGNNELEY